MELLGIFVLIIYVGGILILFMFLFLVLESNKSLFFLAKYNYSFLSLFNLTVLFFVLIFFFYNFLIYFDVSADISYLMNSYNKNLLYKYTIFKSSISGFALSYQYKLSFLLFTVYSIHLFISFLIFLVSLIGVVSLLSGENSYYVYSYILLPNDKNKNTNFIIISEIIENMIFSDYDIQFIIIYTFSLSILIILSFLPYYVYNFNIIKFLLLIEVLVIIIILLLTIFSYFFSDISGCIFSVFILGCYAAETAIVLSLLSYSSLQETSFNIN